MLITRETGLPCTYCGYASGFKFIVPSTPNSILRVWRFLHLFRRLYPRLILWHQEGIPSPLFVTEYMLTKRSLSPQKYRYTYDGGDTISLISTVGDCTRYLKALFTIFKVIPMPARPDSISKGIPASPRIIPS